MLPCELIGSVDLIEVKEDAVVESTPTSHGKEDKVYVATVVSQVENEKLEKLANRLTKGKDPDSEVGQ